MDLVKGMFESTSNAVIKQTLTLLSAFLSTSLISYKCVYVAQSISSIYFAIPPILGVFKIAFVAASG
jgi:hypothetical protein